MTSAKTIIRSFPSTRGAGQDVIALQGNLAVRPRPEPFPELGEIANLAELDLEIDPHARIFWQFMKPNNRPSFTMGLLSDMRKAQAWIESTLLKSATAGQAPIRYVVTSSRMGGIFNLGGDLPLFAQLIQTGDRDMLRQYAHACIEVQYQRATNMNVPIISISLVQGDALGGGFECALTADVIIAERKAKFGVPEILFGLYPGMGAYSVLSRRIGANRAEEMILSGRVYTATELHEMGLVDVLADDGHGEAVVYDYVERADRSFGARCAVYNVRRMVNPITREELFAITDLWVETALKLDPINLRKMARIATAQDRRWNTVIRSS
ncbi:MAG: crotonase/enoyl-CoA hydratase family protein [Alphaproteobacteria bacterium]